MRTKQREISDPNSCLNKAKGDEFIFVLPARDPAAAETVLFWAKERVSLGLNDPDDPQITEARAWAIWGLVYAEEDYGNSQ